MSDINYLAEIKIASLTSHDTCGSLEQRAPDLESIVPDVDLGFYTRIFQILRCTTREMGQ